MEPEGALPNSQLLSTRPYPETPRSSPYPHILLTEDPSQYYPPIYTWVSQMVSFLQVSPPKPCIHLSSHPYALHAPPISFSILSPEQFWVRSTIYFATTTSSWSVSQSAPLKLCTSSILECHLLSISMWSICLWVFPSGEVQVYLWMS